MAQHLQGLGFRVYRVEGLGFRGLGFRILHNFGVHVILSFEMLFNFAVSCSGAFSRDSRLSSFS